MLSRSQRLRAHEVVEVLARGRSVRLGGLQVKFLPAHEPLRSAAVVPKSVVRKATKRNSLRRALYRALAEVGARQGRAVFLLRALPPNTSALREDLMQLLPKL